MPAIVYRLTRFGRIVPYVGVGPRIYLLESITEGSVGKAMMLETKERSTKVGVGLPLGVDFKLGPGVLLGEFVFELGPLDHDLTGKTNTAAGTLEFGYRIMI